MHKLNLEKITIRIFKYQKPKLQKEAREKKIKVSQLIREKLDK